MCQSRVPGFRLCPRLCPSVSRLTGCGGALDGVGWGGTGPMPRYGETRDGPSAPLPSSAQPGPAQSGLQADRIDWCAMARGGVGSAQLRGWEHTCNASTCLYASAPPSLPQTSPPHTKGTDGNLQAKGQRNSRPLPLSPRLIVDSSRSDRATLLEQDRHHIAPRVPTLARLAGRPRGTGRSDHSYEDPLGVLSLGDAAL